MNAAVVLAAGRSNRMGRPKMVLPWGDTTVIGRVVVVLEEARLEPIIVVTGGAEAEVREALENTSARTVFNPQFTNGEMLLSLQTGLAALPMEAPSMLVVLGDQPQIEADVVREVLGMAQFWPEKIVVPSYHRRRGHPWLLPASLRAELMAMVSPSTLHHFLQAHQGDIQYLPVETPSILRDLDTPEDYQKFKPE